MDNNINYQNKTKHYAIIDSYSQKTVDVDGDKIPDTSHGEVVEKVIRDRHPGVKISRYDTASDKYKHALDQKKTMNALDDIYDRIKSGEHFDGVNLSASSDVRIKSLNRYTDPDHPISKDNISENEAKLRNNDRYKSNLEYWKTDKVINKLEKVTSEGVPVYTAAGNDGPKNYNQYGLAKGVTQVGALGVDGKKHPSSADNSDVKRWAQGEVEIKSVKDSSGKIKGYDYTGDGKMDISADKTSGKGKTFKPKKIFGTSFSTPKALSEDK